MIRLISTVLFLVPVLLAGGWTPPVDVRDDGERLVSYRARLHGDYLLVEAAHEGGWHTIAMDNKRRVEEKLAGRKALALDMPTEIKVTDGLEVVGPWYQTPPIESSKPELMLFSWVFEKQALFAARVRRVGAGPAQVAIRGQVCTETACRRIDLTIPLPLSDRSGQGVPAELKRLETVRP